MITDKIDYKSAYENVLIANNMLRKENQQLHNKIDKAIEILKLCNSQCSKETIELLTSDIK